MWSKPEEFVTELQAFSDEKLREERADFQEALRRCVKTPENAVYHHLLVEWLTALIGLVECEQQDRAPDSAAKETKLHR